jgi:hypothetical protein
VSAAEDVETCARLGAELAAMAPRVALLAMGDGTARRGVKAPGYLDPRAEPYDARAVDALRRGSPSALLRLDPEQGRDLLVAGRAAWQVLAGPPGPSRRR